MKPRYGSCPAYLICVDSQSRVLQASKPRNDVYTDETHPHRAVVRSLLFPERRQPLFIVASEATEAVSHIGASEVHCCSWGLSLAEGVMGEVIFIVEASLFFLYLVLRTEAVIWVFCSNPVFETISHISVFLPGQRQCHV